MSKCKVKVGDKYNLLTVVEKTEKRTKSGNVIWKCLCECGNYTYITSSSLTSNHTKSCGCYFLELSKKRMKENSKYYLSLRKPRKTTPNEIIEKKDYIIILCNEKQVLVDKEDYPKICERRWYVNNGYSYDRFGKILHREILEAQKDQIVDHINGNGLDNRKQNLRFVTKSQNGQNRKCKGITYDKQRKKWCANIVVNGKRYFLGRYSTEEEAKTARINGEIKYQGEYRYNGN